MPDQHVQRSNSVILPLTDWMPCSHWPGQKLWTGCWIMCVQAAEWRIRTVWNPLLAPEDTSFAYLPTTPSPVRGNSTISSGQLKSPACGYRSHRSIRWRVRLKRTRNSTKGTSSGALRCGSAAATDLVGGEFLEHAGPSRYFARVAGDAAVEWKFAPADSQGSRVWLLHFEFDRDGVTADATAAH